MTAEPLADTQASEAYQRGRAAGWHEGYAAACRDQSEWIAATPEIVDAAIIHRVTEVLVMLRERAAA